MNDIPEHYKKSNFYCWQGIYYYKNQPCEKVSIAIPGNIIDRAGDRASSVDIHDTGYIIGKSLCGDIKLKILKP